ncbi:MAG: toll/interleukin-1 receptor domain-containing protein [Methylobacter sp.]
MIRVFLSYSHADEKYRNELAKHLKILQRQGIIETWHDRCLLPGDNWASGIDRNLRNADIILLLISIDFINSEYCFDLEMTEAITRHDRGEAIVIPVILRPCHWTGLPFGKLQAATKDGKPVDKYPSFDDAFLEITRGIEAVAKRLSAESNRSDAISSAISAPSENLGFSQPPLASPESPRSSNLAIPKIFTDHDRDTFITEAFSFISNYFENSLDELQRRNPETKTSFKNVDTNSFEASIYFNGHQVTKCGIWLGGMFGSRGSASIIYSHAGLGQKNGWNESMSIKDNGNILGLEPMGMSHLLQTEKRPLTNEGAAEYYWSMFFEPVQRRQ